MNRHLLAAGTTLVGLDAEFLPAVGSVEDDDTNRPALLQVATRQWAFLFDLAAWSGECDALIADLFTSSRIRKLGYEYVVHLTHPHCRL